MKNFIASIGISLLLTTLTLPAYAKSDEEASYQYSVFVGYTDGTLSESAIDFDATAYRVGGIINFSQLNIVADAQPLAEVEFMERASTLSFLYEDGEVEIDSLDSDLSDYAVSLRLANKSTNFTAGAEFIRYNLAGIEVDEIRVRGGYYTGKTTEVGIEYRNMETDISGPVEIDIYALSFKHVATATSRSPYGERNTALAVEAIVGYEDIDGETNFLWEADVTVYLTNFFGLGFGYTGINDDAENNQRRLSVKWFVTPKTSVDIKYSEIELGSSDLNYEELTLDLSMRF